MGHGQTQKMGIEGRGSRGIGYAHFAYGQTARALVHCLQGQGNAVAQTGAAGFKAHGWAMGNIVRALPKTPVDDPFIGKGAATAAGIHNDEIHAAGPGQGIDGSTSGQEVGHHLPRHFLRIEGHTFAAHPVIACHGKELGRCHMEGMAHACQTVGNVLQTPETAPGLGLIIDMGQGPSPGLLVQRRYGTSCRKDLPGIGKGC